MSRLLCIFVRRGIVAELALTGFKNGTYAKGSFQPLQISGVIGTITDISDQRLLEESRLAHVQDREAEARRRAEDAEERRKEADERRRGQGNNDYLHPSAVWFFFINLTGIALKNF